MYIKKNTSGTQRRYHKDQHKQQFDEDAEVIDSSADSFQQPSDEEAQGNVLTEEKLALIKMNDSHRSLSKQDAKLAAEQMKKLFKTFTENTQKQLREQGEKRQWKSQR
jgi:hypothetical protein